MLHDLTHQFKQIHSTDYSLRYWRILIEPWLGYFTQILFDRWSSMQQAINQYEFSETIVLTGKEGRSLVPDDMLDFVRLFLGDEWDHHLYASILEEYVNVTCITRTRTGPKEFAKALPTHTGWKRQAIRMLAAWYRYFSSMLANDWDFFS